MPKGGARAGAGRPKTRMPSRIAKEPLPADAPLGVRPGPKLGNLMNNRKPKRRLARDTIEGRIRELLRRGDEQSKTEAAILAVQLLPYEEPRLQAVMAKTLLETGDSLTRLLREIDGGTTGIAQGIAISGSALAIEQSVRLSDEGGKDDSVPPELGSGGAAE
jgi:hypothetical protein